MPSFIALSALTVISTLLSVNAFTIAPLRLECLDGDLQDSGFSSYSTTIITDPTACANECATTNGVHVATEYALYKDVGNGNHKCLCIPAEQGLPPYLARPSDGNQLDCYVGDWWYLDSASSYTLDGCYTIDDSQPPTTPVSSTADFDYPAQCLDYCKGWSTLVMLPYYFWDAEDEIEEFSYRCYCSAELPPAIEEHECDRNIYQIYNHDAMAVASQLSRRHYRSRVPRDQIEYCPAGKTACRVAATDGFECLDTSSELESCGGCLYGQYGNSTVKSGQDCSSIPGASMGGATCDKGSCVISQCRKGWILNTNTNHCIKALSTSSTWKLL